MKTLTGKNTIQSLFIFFLIFLSFGTRMTIHRFISGFHEYETAFLYAGDIFLILFLFLGWRYIKNAFLDQGPILLISLGLFELFAFLSIFFAYSPGLAIYNFIRLELLMFFALGLGEMVRQKIITPKIIFGSIAVLAALQALIGVGQFAIQRSFGLGILGESTLSPNVPGVAKIPVAGLRLIRGYGTFPHPNVLAAFLLLGLFSLYWWYIKYDWEKMGFVYDKRKSIRKNFTEYRRATKFGRRLAVSVGIGAVISGIVFSFSRAAWLIGTFLTVLFIGRLFSRKEYRRPTRRLLIMIVAITVLIISIFHWAVFPRAVISAREPAVTERIAYNKIGVNIIENNFSGVGIGNQVLYAVKNNIYQDLTGMDRAYEWQPVHNLYLLVASEIGVVGLLAFLTFLLLLFLNPEQYQNSNTENPKRFWPFKFQISNLFQVSSLEFGISRLMLVALLLYGLGDHFLWTLEPGRIMLWLIIGFLLGTRGIAGKVGISKRP